MDRAQSATDRAAAGLLQPLMCPIVYIDTMLQTAEAAAAKLNRQV